MRKLLLLLLILPYVMLMTSCECEKSETKFFKDTEFILVEKKMTVEEDGNGRLNNYRTWVIHTVDKYSDSVYVGTIKSDVEYDGISKYKITDELWHNKNVGDKLHFEFIGKNRFYRLEKSKIKPYDKPIITKEYVYSGDYESTSSTTTINLNNLEIERRIMELDREIMTLERERDMLKDSQ